MKPKDEKRPKTKKGSNDLKIQTMLSPTMADMVASGPSLDAEGLEKGFKLLTSASTSEVDGEKDDSGSDEDKQQKSGSQPSQKSTTKEKIKTSKDGSQKPKSESDPSSDTSERTVHQPLVVGNQNFEFLGAEKHSNKHPDSAKSSKNRGSSKSPRLEKGLETSETPDSGSDNRQNSEKGAKKRSQKPSSSDKRSRQHPDSQKIDSGEGSVEELGSREGSPHQTDSQGQLGSHKRSNKRSEKQSSHRSRTEKHISPEGGTRDHSRKPSDPAKRSNRRTDKHTSPEGGSRDDSRKNSDPAKRSDRRSSAGRSTVTTSSSGKSTLLCMPLDTEFNQRPDDDSPVDVMDEPTGSDNVIDEHTGSDNAVSTACTKLPSIIEAHKVRVYKKGKGIRGRKGSKKNRVFRGWDTGPLAPHTFDKLPNYQEIIPHIQMYIRSHVLKPDPVLPAVTSPAGISPRDYLAKHDIESIFKILTTGLLTRRPSSPLDYLISVLSRWSEMVKAKDLPIEDYTQCRLPTLRGPPRPPSRMSVTEIIAKCAEEDGFETIRCYY